MRIRQIALLWALVLPVLSWAQSRDNVNDIALGLRVSATEAEVEATELTIASYNVQCRPFLDKAEEKLPKIAPRLSPFDIVLLQECFTGHRLLWQGTAFANKVYFGRPAAKGKLAGSGLVVLTRFPASEPSFVHFTSVGEWQNRAASKGLVLIPLRVAGVSLDVYNTHMEAGATPAAQKARKEQVAQMIAFINEHSPPDHAVLLMGDFNMGPRRTGKNWRDYQPNHYESEEDNRARTEAFENLRAGLGLRDAADEVHGRTDDGIERLLFRAGSRAIIKPITCEVDSKRFRRDDGTSLSDGSPLVVKIRIARK